MLLLLLSRFSHVWLCATRETAAHQAPPSLGFSRQEHWSGLPFPSAMCESEVAQSCPTPSDPMDCSPPGSSIHGILQARVLEWVATAFSSCFMSLPQLFQVGPIVCLSPSIPGALDFSMPFPGHMTFRNVLQPNVCQLPYWWSWSDTTTWSYWATVRTDVCKVLIKVLVHSKHSWMLLAFLLLLKACT